MAITNNGLFQAKTKFGLRRVDCVYILEPKTKIRQKQLKYIL